MNLRLSFPHITMKSFILLLLLLFAILGFLGSVGSVGSVGSLASLRTRRKKLRLPPLILDRSVDHVIKWLKHVVCLPEYVAQFNQHKISGKKLAALVAAMDKPSSFAKTSIIGKTTERAYLEHKVFFSSRKAYVAVVWAPIDEVPEATRAKL